MKTISNKKLSLDLSTVRVLNADTLTLVHGGIVSTDTPSLCFACEPRPQPAKW